MSHANYHCIATVYSLEQDFNRMFTLMLNYRPQLLSPIDPLTFIYTNLKHDESDNMTAYCWFLNVILSPTSKAYIKT